MLDNTKKWINKLLSKTGYQLTSTQVDKFDSIIAADKRFLEIYETCRNYTMTSMPRCFALYQALEYVIKNNIPGDFVECGVWRGGSAMVMAMTAKSLGVTDRKIYLYDTFEGMSEPTEKDVFIGQSMSARKEWASKQTKDHNEWCYASLDDVKNNMSKTGYPESNLVFMKGKVEDTIPTDAPDKIALLRLDTDWYESTKHELVHLYPLLSEHGILILDDYGSWSGAKKAVDEYFSKQSPLLNRIDASSRLVVKTK